MRLATILLAMLLLVSGCSLLLGDRPPDGGGGNVDGNPNEPIVDPDAPPGGGDDGDGDGSLREQPDPTIVDARGVAADHFRIGPDGRTLVAYWWGGTPGCFGLQEVMLEVQDGTPIVTVLEGTRPEAVGKACTAEAVLKSAVVTLDQPILLDGSGNQHPAGEAVIAPNPLEVDPAAGVVNPRPHAVGGYRLSGDGSRLEVHYTGGTPDCYGLASAEVEPAAAGGLTVTIAEGSLPNPAVACPDIGVSKVVILTLDEPLIVQAAFDS